MDTNKRLTLLLAAAPKQLEAVDAILEGQIKPEPRSFRMYRMSEASQATGLSRTSLWRACKEGRIRTVEVRKGSRRIPESELRRFVEGRK